MNIKIKYLEHIIEEIKTSVKVIELPKDFFEDYKDVLIYNNLNGIIVYEYVINDHKGRINKLLTFETYKPLIRLIENGTMFRILDEELDSINLDDLDKGGFYNKTYKIDEEEN